ncbi:hypothetical protein [Actinomadura miaoliensis]|uniref:Uncharacterized protein n=1 Tax=Actinomadura miaoliensis TaxID=430685 RepID=A0ABP7VAR6_9ACTN
MTPCAVVTGFFLLSQCGRPAAGACGQCGRPVCQEHVGQNGLCPECGASLREVTDPHDPAWTSGYRRWFQQRSSRTYNDNSWYSYSYASFDDYDRGAFEPGNDWSRGSGDFGGSDDDTGFVDS